MKRAVVAILSLACIAAPTIPPASAETMKSDNVDVTFESPFDSANEVARSGDVMYVSEWYEGIHVLDVSGRSPRFLGTVPCSGYANDVAVVKPGLIAVGFETGPCGPFPALAGGVQLIDVSNPKRPRYLDGLEIVGGVHTITMYPGKPLIYASPGGTVPVGDDGNPSGAETIIDVSDPSNLTVAATYLFTPSGCHDVTFSFTGEEKLGFCPGQGGTQVWDVSDPLLPQRIAHIVLPALELPHSVAVSSDGEVIAISNEDFAAHECTAEGPTGGLWIYDITDPRNPRMTGYYKAPRYWLPIGSLPVTNSCTAHNNTFVPGTRTLLTTWYNSGTSVVDLTDPANPAEVAYYMPDLAMALTAYWHQGRVYVTDGTKGLHVLKVRELRASPTRP